MRTLHCRQDYCDGPDRRSVPDLRFARGGNQRGCVSLFRWRGAWLAACVDAKSAPRVNAKSDPRVDTKSATTMGTVCS
jgi:hypothetical protein